MSIFVGPLPAISARVVTPWCGAWLADVDVDLTDVPVAPQGPTVLTIGTNILQGNIDDRASGRFGNIARLRIVGGRGGWDKELPAVPFHNDAGVTGAEVRQATAASILETLLDPLGAFQVLGVDYLRLAGPAARVLPPGGWYVNYLGITTTAPRVPIPFDPTSVTILSYDPLTNRVEFASDDLMQPGTVLLDTRFGTLTVRDVDQTFDENGSKGIAWCSSSAASQLVTALGKIAREATRSDYLKTYVYRVGAQNADGRLILQAVHPSKGAPDAVLISPWYGVPGFSAKFALLGAEVLLAFPEGDPGNPKVISFDGSRPLQVKCGAGLSPVALAAPQTTINAALAAAVASLLTTIPAMVTGYSALTDPQKTAFAAAMGAVATAMQAQAALVPSTLLFSD